MKWGRGGLLLLGGALCASAVEDPRFPSCHLLRERLGQCWRRQGDVQACMELEGQTLEACFSQARGVLQQCKQAGTPLASCLGPEVDAFRGALARRAAETNNTCAADFSAQLRTVEGAESLLVSGRVLLSFALTLKILGEAGQGGGVSSFLLYQHLASYGDPDACRAIPNHHYCWVAPTFMYMDRTGFCMPSSCALSDLPSVINPIIHGPLAEMIAGMANVTIPDLTLDNVVGQCGAFRYKATPGTWLVLALTVLLGVLVLGGTWVDHLTLKHGAQGGDKAAAEAARKGSDGYVSLAAEESKAGRASRDGGDEEQGPGGSGRAEGNGMNEPLLGARAKKPSAPLFLRVLGCFSLYRTWPSLVAPARPGDLNSLDGIRVFSMSWVIMGHLLAFESLLLGFTNTDAILPPSGIMSTYSGQALFAGEFAVDTFFCIGAFLAAYLMVQHLAKAFKPPAEGEDKKPLGWVWVPMLYVHRWLRLTPSYFFVLLFYWKVVRVMDSGPFWQLLEQDYHACDQYWWSNLLYINTLVPWDLSKGMCYAVSWYMSVDFLLFIFLPLLVLIFLKNRWAGYLTSSLLGIASIAYSWQLAYRENMLQFGILNQLGGLTANKYQTDYYFRFWTRAPAYLVGVLFAFAWFDFRGSQGKAEGRSGRRALKVTWEVAVAFAVSFFLLGSVVYGATPAFQPPGFPAWLDHWYLAMSRTAWCVGLCTLCWLMFSGYGGLIKGLLENRVMAVLSRLTFLAYLIHPTVMYFVFIDVAQPQHYSSVWYGYNLIGTVSVVFLLSAVCHLLVEKPMANLERLLLSGGGKKAS